MYQKKAMLVGYAYSHPLERKKPIYQALQPIECAACNRTIEPGQKFVRRMLKGGGQRTYSVCLQCSPVEGEV